MWRFLIFFFWIIAFIRGADIKDKKTVTKKPVTKPVTCLFGQPCVLPCRIQEGLFKFMWSKKSLVIQYFPRIGQYHMHRLYINGTSLFEQEFQDGNCSLAISNTTLKDNGIFKCVIESQSDSKVLYFKVQVNVPVKEVVIKRLGDFLICSSERVHPKPECRWSDDFSNSSLTVAPDDQLLHSINCTTPLLRNVSQYTCTVSTQFSSKRAIYVQMPRITVSGTKASLPCASSSSSVKNLSWIFNHNETILNHSETILNQSMREQVSERWSPFVKSVSGSGSLNLEKLTSHQQGQFTCVTSTDTETYTAVTWLEIKEPLSEYLPFVIAAAVVVLTRLGLSTYKRKETNSDSEPVSLQRSHKAMLVCGVSGVSMFLCQLFEISSLYLNRHMDQTWIFSFIVLVSQLPTLISVVVNYFSVPRFSPQKHTLGCLILVCVIFVTMLICIMVPISKEIFFCINMCSLWLVSLFSCMITHNLNVKVDSLPKILRNLGQSFVRTLASIVIIISVAFKDAAKMQLCCYSVAIVVSLISSVTYWICHCNSNQKHQTEEEKGVPLNDLRNNNKKEPPQCPDGESTNTTGGNFCTFWYVAVVPMLTSSVYPAVIADVPTMSSGTWERFFIPVCSFLVFNICNWIGQKLFRIFEAIFLKHFLILSPLLFIFHTGLMVMLFSCHIFPIVRQYNNEVFPITMAFFSLSHVFLSHLSELYEQHLGRSAGPDISKNLWRAIGDTAGVVLSFAFRALVQFIAPN